MVLLSVTLSYVGMLKIQIVSNEVDFLLS